LNDFFGAVLQHERRLHLIRQECQAEAQRQLEAAAREYEVTLHGLKAELEVFQSESAKAKLRFGTAR
jgi:hypothetical protein